MERHITLLGILFICYHLTAIAAAIIILITFMWISALGGEAMRHALDWLPFVPMNIFSIIGWAVSGVMITAALPGLIAGIGLVHFRNWARIVALITAVFMLFIIPVGTMLAVYAFWVLFSDKSVKLFK